MWKILSVFMLAKAIVIEANCDPDDFARLCPKPKLVQQIPLEVEEFNRQCPKIIPYFVCTKEFLLNCWRTKDSVSPEIHESSKLFYGELCKEGTDLNEIAKSNLYCLNVTLSNTNCQVEKDAFIESQMEDVRIIGRQAPLRTYCLAEVLFAECIKTDITMSCGTRVGRAAMEYFHRTLRIDAQCPLFLRDSLLEDIDDFKLTEKQKRFAVEELERVHELDAK